MGWQHHDDGNLVTMAERVQGKGSARRRSIKPGLFEEGYDSIDWKRKPLPAASVNLEEKLKALKAAEEPLVLPPITSTGVAFDWSRYWGSAAGTGYRI